MEPIKRRILELLDADRVRLRQHFSSQAYERGIGVEDALRAVRSGALQAGRADTDARYGERHLFRGRDRSNRVLDIVVSIDDAHDCVWLHTVYER